MSYIKHIVNYFFHHNVSEELKNRVYHRMIYPLKDNERDEALQEIWKELGNEQHCHEDESVEKAFERIRPNLKDPVGRPKRINLPFTKWIRLASMWLIPFIMLCTSGYFYFSAFRNNALKTLQPISYVQHYASVGTREKVILSDSSEIWLNAGSSLLYPSTFTTSNREVFLTGEAFFDVKKDSSHPFIVNTRYMKIQALGTSFNVSAYPDEPQMETTLETGLLKVNIAGNPSNYYLNPNEQVVYIPSTQTIEYHQVNASDYSQWRMGGLLFNNVLFEDALSTLERFYGVEIHLMTSIYKGHKIHVHFNKDESLENILLIIKLMLPEINYRIVGKKVYIE